MMSLVTSGVSQVDSVTPVNSEGKKKRTNCKDNSQVSNPSSNLLK